MLGSLQPQNTVKYTKTQCGVTAFLTFHSPTNFAVFLPSGHNNLLLSDCIPLCPSPFSVHFYSHSILVMLQYSTFMRSGLLVSRDANAFSCAMRQRLSFGFNLTGQRVHQSLRTFTPRLP